MVTADRRSYPISFRYEPGTLAELAARSCVEMPGQAGAGDEH